MTKAELYGSAEMRRLRANAPRQDRKQPIFHPMHPAAPKAAQGTPQPITIEMLDATCGRYAAAAKAEAEWTAVSDWLDGFPALFHDLGLARSAVELVREFDRKRWGYPHAARKIPARPVLCGLSPKSRREAIALAAETLEAWEKADRPGLSAATILSISTYVEGFLRREARTNPSFQPKDS